LIEGKELPIYASQFHPEVQIFEWNTDVKSNHSPETVLFSQHLGRFIVGEIRKNNNTFGSFEEEDKWLIYNHPPTQVFNFYNQVYFFKNEKKKNSTTDGNGQH
jgi:gamma-glutamyl hydrolase